MCDMRLASHRVHKCSTIRIQLNMPKPHLRHGRQALDGNKLFVRAPSRLSPERVAGGESHRWRGAFVAYNLVNLD